MRVESVVLAWEQAGSTGVACQGEHFKVSLTRLPGPSVCVAAVTGCVGCVPPGPGVSGGAGGRMLVAAVSRCQRTGVELGGRMDVV